MNSEYIFNVGDEVIRDDGSVGRITSICTCDRCEARGFYEPTVDFDSGNMSYITDWDYKDGFSGYYKIGDYVFGNLESLESKQNFIDRYEDILKRLYVQKEVIEKLMEVQNESK